MLSSSSNSSVVVRALQPSSPASFASGRPLVQQEQRPQTSLNTFAGQKEEEEEEEENYGQNGGLCVVGGDGPVAPRLPFFFPVGNDWRAFAAHLRDRMQTTTRPLVHRRALAAMQRAKVLEDAGRPVLYSVDCSLPAAGTNPLYHRRVLEREHMSMFGLWPTNDPVDIVMCRHCSKPVRRSQFAGHIGRCASVPNSQITANANGATAAVIADAGSSKSKTKTTKGKVKSKAKVKGKSDETIVIPTGGGRSRSSSKAKTRSRSKSKSKGKSKGKSKSKSAKAKSKGDGQSPTESSSSSNRKRKSSSSSLSSPSSPISCKQSKGPSDSATKSRKRSSSSGRSTKRTPAPLQSNRSQNAKRQRTASASMHADRQSRIHSLLHSLASTTTSSANINGSSLSSSPTATQSCSAVATSTWVSPFATTTTDMKTNNSDFAFVRQSSLSSNNHSHTNGTFCRPHVVTAADDDRLASLFDEATKSLPAPLASRTYTIRSKLPDVFSSLIHHHSYN